MNSITVGMIIRRWQERGQYGIGLVNDIEELIRDEIALERKACAKLALSFAGQFGEEDVHEVYPAIAKAILERSAP